MPSTGKAIGARAWLAMAAILIAAVVLTLNRLGAGNVCSANEAVEGLAMQGIIERGETFPLLNGIEPMYKPPLFHWTALAIDRLAGMHKVTAFNLRLPSALYAIAGVALTMALALSLIGARGAILSGLILIGSYQYIDQGRYGRVDMTLTFFESVTLFGFLFWSHARDHARHDAMEVWRYVLAIALGAAVLAKGPVGALLPLAAILIFLALERRLHEIGSLFSPGNTFSAIAIGSSWYGACLIASRYGFLNQQLASENLGRFLGVLGAMPPWYYVEPILFNSAPMSLLVPIAIAAVIVARRDGRARAGVYLLAIFWIVTVAFFSISAYKRRSYLLPLWPPAAVLLAWWIEEITAAKPWGRIVRAAFAAICLVCAGFNFYYVPLKEIRDCAADSYKQAAADINRVVGKDERLSVYGIGADLTPLLFYLDRDAIQLTGKLADAPPGYVAVPKEIWEREKSSTLELEPVLTSVSGRHTLILLRHGKTYARSQFERARDELMIRQVAPEVRWRSRRHHRR